MTSPDYTPPGLVRRIFSSPPARILVLHTEQVFAVAVNRLFLQVAYDPVRDFRGHQIEQEIEVEECALHQQDQQTIKPGGVSSTTAR